MGSDYPYPLGERPAGDVVRTADFLDHDQRDAVLGGNAERFLSTPVPMTDTTGGHHG